MGKTIYASIGTAIPEDPKLNGYITEYQGYCNNEDVGSYAEKMAAYMLETAFNIKSKKTFNITIKADVEKYTSVVAAAVFVM